MKENITKEKLTFDDAAYAQSVKEQEITYLETVRPGLKIAGIATCINIFMMLVGSTLLYVLDMSSPTLSNVMAIIWVCSIPVLTIYSYAKGGGIGTALKTWFTVIKWAWLVIFFPLDIIAVVLVIGYGGLAIILAPIVFVYINYRNHKKNLEAAEEYLKFCK